MAYITSTKSLVLTVQIAVDDIMDFQLLSMLMNPNETVKSIICSTQNLCITNQPLIYYFHLSVLIDPFCNEIFGRNYFINIGENIDIPGVCIWNRIVKMKSFFFFVWILTSRISLILPPPFPITQPAKLWCINKRKSISLSACLNRIQQKKTIKFNDNGNYVLKSKNHY